MKWYVDRGSTAYALGSTSSYASASGAAICEWEGNESLRIVTPQRFLRTDGVNITKEVEAICFEYKASYDISTEPSFVSNVLWSAVNEQVVTLRMKFPLLKFPLNWAPSIGTLQGISISLCSMMWGTSATSAPLNGDNMGSFIKVPSATVDEFKNVSDSFKKAWNVAVKKTDYQSVYNALMKDQTPLSEMELKVPLVIAPSEAQTLQDAITAAMDPFIGEQLTASNKYSMQVAAGNAIATWIDIEAIKKLPQGWQAKFPVEPMDGIVKVTPGPQKSTDSPSAEELAILEFEGLGRDC